MLTTEVCARGVASETPHMPREPGGEIAAESFRLLLRAGYCCFPPVCVSEKIPEATHLGSVSVGLP